MGKVKFGLRVPGTPMDDSQGTVYTDQIENFLEKLDGKFDSIWISDHFFSCFWWEHPLVDTLEALTTLSYLAGRFPSYELGNNVLCNSYRNPALLAKMGATLQTLSGGRFILAIGAGWKEDEYRAYGYDFPPFRVRVKQLEEAVQIIRKMWTEDDPSFAGEYYRIEHAHCEPRPDPVPPIMIGGVGEKYTLRLVAQHADMWNMSASDIDMFRHKLNVLKRHCDEVGRDFNEITPAWSTEAVVIAETEAGADRLAQQSPFSRGIPPIPPPEVDPRPFPTDPMKEGIVGTPEQVTEGLKQFTDLGAEHFIMRFVDFPDTNMAELFAEQVIPNFR
ncbi:MAG: LLM class flavin-dependent oxidoreductase [Candidatus Bipolaricaulia bacterium]